MLPCWSSARPCGPELGVFRGYSLNWLVLGSNRPSTLANCPVYQIEPSAAASGSCGREPGVGTGHSSMAALALPGNTTASGLGFSGKFLARYWVTTAI